MNTNEIIESAVPDVERIVGRLMASSKNPPGLDTKDDLVQDILLILLEKDGKLIKSLYDKGELGYYILKIAENQLLSKNSPYYKKYINERARSEDVEDYKDTIVGED